MLILSLLTSLTWATSQSVEIIDALIAKDVVARQPVEPAEHFDAEVGALVCWTKVTSHAVPTKITHVWYYEDRQVMRIALDVKTAKWRTWSRKTVHSNHTGRWKVEVLDENGSLLKTVNFSVIDDAEPEAESPESGG